MAPMVPMMLGMAADAVAPGSHAHLELDKVVDLTAMLPAITAPTLVLAGSDDLLVPPLNAHLLAWAITQAGLFGLFFAAASLPRTIAAAPSEDGQDSR